jgi:hypothetical protein
MVCMEDEVETLSAMASNKTSGWWELWGSMKHDELRDMGCLMPTKKKTY